MGGKFDSESVVRTAMLTRDKTFDDCTRTNLQPLDLVERLRVEIVLGFRFQCSVLGVRLSVLGVRLSVFVATN